MNAKGTEVQLGPFQDGNLAREFQRLDGDFIWGRT